MQEAQEKTSTEAEIIETPKSITYLREDIPTTLVMSFGLLNCLLKRIGSLENVGYVGIDGTVNEVLLLELLQIRDGRGKVMEPALTNISDISVSVEDMESLLDFARDHLLDFSVRTAQRASAQAAKRNVQLKKVSDLTAGLIGRLDSPTKS